MRPLDGLPSIKLKLGAAIVTAVVAGSLVGALTIRAGLPLLLSPVVTAVIALGIVQVLAHGMTSPLREMVAATAAMARGDHGHRVTATSNDEVGQLARAFNEMTAELAEIDRVRRDLVANVSHELRTPISALQATLENLIDGVVHADPTTFDAMLRQVQRLGRLVAQLLDLSRLESGAIPLQARRFDVAGLLDKVVAEASPLVEHVTVTATTDPPDLTAHADPERLHQVVANLVENALRFSPDGSIVEVRAHDDDGLLVEVDDRGPGIPAEEAEQVFERFYRADTARRSDGGAGLGLAIARWIVELHGGRIWTEERPSGGCRMVLHLPPASTRPIYEHTTDTHTQHVDPTAPGGARPPAATPR